MTSQAKSPEEYLSNVPEERLPALEKLRKVILDNLPKGFEEGIGYGMLAYFVPHSLYPNGYHCTPELPLPFINIASQKNFIALYHSGVYAKPELQDWFVSEYAKHCKYKLDMGKSCVRFKKFDDIPYNLIAELTAKISVKEWITIYETNINKK